MKRITSVFLIAVVIAFAACSSNGNNSNTSSPAGADTIVNQNPTVVQQDSAILSDDSATVKTARGVQLEETNAVQQEKQEAQKLKNDEQLQKK